MKNIFLSILMAIGVVAMVQADAKAEQQKANALCYRLRLQDTATRDNYEQLQVALQNALPAGAETVANLDTQEVEVATTANAATMLEVFRGLAGAFPMLSPLTTCSGDVVGELETETPKGDNEKGDTKKSEDVRE